MRNLIFETCLNTFVAIGLLLLNNVGVKAQTATPTSPDAVAKTVPRNHSDDSEDRISALIRKMTLAEKIGQMEQSNNVDIEGPGNTVHAAQDSLGDRIREGRIGSVLNEVDPANINRLQKIAVEESRVGVPLIFGRD